MVVTNQLFERIYIAFFVVEPKCYGLGAIDVANRLFAFEAETRLDLFLSAR